MEAAQSPQAAFHKNVHNQGVLSAGVSQLLKGNSNYRQTMNKYQVGCAQSNKCIFLSNANGQYWIWMIAVKEISIFAMF